MSDLFQRRLWVLLFSATTACVVWNFSPGSELDRFAFTQLSEISTGASLPISGNGTHASPWTLGEIVTYKRRPQRVPTVISVGDDPQGFFQASPPAPIDFSVILANFKRLGADSAAIAAVLAWDEPDPIALAALEKSLADFDSLIMAAPLSRGAVSSAMPPAFRRASLPLTAIRGNHSLLPRVNCIAVSGIILGGETTMAGFSILESGDDVSDEFFPLMAQWEDRLVFAFPLLVVLQQMYLPLDQIKVELGKSIQLGSTGPTIKIDEFGRIAIPTNTPSLLQIPAQSIIDGDANMLRRTNSDFLILRDDQSSVEPATREFSQNLSAMIAAMAAGKKTEMPLIYPRLSTFEELGLLAIFVMLVTLFSSRNHWLRFCGCVLLVSACVLAQWFAMRSVALWLPGIAMLASALAGLVIGTLFLRKAKFAPILELPPMPKPTQSFGPPQPPIKPTVTTLPTLPVGKSAQKSSPDKP